jgi:hypothetical protein
LQAAQDLATVVENLSLEEKAQLRKSLDDLIRDTPQTQVAAMRFKQLMVKAGTATASAFRELLIDIASEAAKKALWP